MRFWLGVGAGILGAWGVFAVAMHVERVVYSGATSPRTKSWQDAAWDIYDEIASGPAD